MRLVATPSCGRHAWIALLLSASCAGAKPGAPAPFAPSAPSPLTVSSAEPAPERPRIKVALRPSVDPAAILVEIEVRAPPPALAEWAFSAGGGAPGLAVSDARGPLVPHVGGGSVTFERAPVGAVHAHYVVLGTDRAVAATDAQLVMDDRFRLSGESLLLLPTALDDTIVDAEVLIDGRKVHAPDAGSSFGKGWSRSARVKGRFLRHMSFLGGALGTAVLDAPEGHDEAVWFGRTAFDPRPVAGELAEVRTGFGDFFNTEEEGPMTYLIFTEPRQDGFFRASARAESILLLVAPTVPWAAPLRLAMGQQLLHSFIGGVLWIGPSDPVHEAESWWFTEGFARYLAAHLLARFDVLDPADVRDELEGEVVELASSPFATQSNAALAAHAGDEKVRSLLTARGAAYATHLAEVLRRKQGSLDEFLRELFVKASGLHRALTFDEWESSLREAAGPGEVEAFHRYVLGGVKLPLPDDALGPCFRATTRTYSLFDLGFDERSARESREHIVVALEPGGPAARAGLRASDVVDGATYRMGQPDSAVKLDLVREGRHLSLSYFPRGPRVRAGGWDRVAGIEDGKCQI